MKSSLALNRNMNSNMRYQIGQRWKRRDNGVVKVVAINYDSQYPITVEMEEKFFFYKNHPNNGKKVTYTVTLDGLVYDHTDPEMHNILKMYGITKNSPIVSPHDLKEIIIN